MNIHSLEWYGPYPSPQSLHDVAMRERRPLVFSLNFDAEVGDMLIFPQFFIQYPVLRFATEEEAKATSPQLWWISCRVVCAEPPQERSDSVTAKDGAPILLRGFP